MATVPINEDDALLQTVATAGQTSIPFDFWVEDADDLDVYQNGTLLTYLTHWTVDDDYLQNDSGGNITLVSGAALNDAFTVTRSTKIDRATGFSESGAASFRGEAINLEFSRIIAMLQDLNRDITRSVRLSAFSTYAGSLTLPSASAGKVLKWASDGLSLTNSTYDPDTQVAAAAASAAAALVSQNAAATSATNASNSASAASTSATNAANSATAAAASAASAVGVGNGVLTTKGDIVGYSTLAARLAVGTDGQVLTADSAQALGIKWATPTTVPSAATQAEQETGSLTSVYTTPGRQHYHPSAAKGWCNFNGAAATPSISASYNTTSLTDIAAGRTGINMTNQMSSANYAVALATCDGDGSNSAFSMKAMPFANNQVRVTGFTSSGGALSDSPLTNASVVWFGDM